MRWTIITGMFNVADLVEPFCRYHLDLGVDCIVAAEYGSTDGTLDLLTPFARAGSVRIAPIPTHRFVDYDPSNVLLAKLREENAADWVSFLDPDEFFTGPRDCKAALEKVRDEGTSALKTSRRNMTATAPPTGDFLAQLDLKIVRPDARVSAATAPLSSPWIFSRIAPKVSVAGDRAGLATIPGDHDVISPNEERTSTDPSFEILHYPIRSYRAFRDKIALTERYFAANPEFGPGIGWHWRRWIVLAKNGSLREEYESQFLAPDLAATRLQSGSIVREERLPAWSREVKYQAAASQQKTASTR